jgi:hypothetical protein
MNKLMLRILAKNSIINQLRFPMTISRFDNTFFILCIDDVNTINFYNNIIMLKHASFIKFVKYFNFSDSYICFFDGYGFVDLLKIYLSHVKLNPKDGTNMILGYVFNGLFVNVFNISLIENILLKHNYFIYFEHFFVQLIFVIIKFIEIFIFYSIDSFFLYVENLIFDF